MRYRYRLVTVVDTDVHLSTADELLSGQQLVVGQHPSVASRPRHLHLGGHRQWHGPGGDDTDAQFCRGVDEHAAAVHEFGPQSVECVDDSGVRLDDAALKLRYIAVRQPFEQLRAPGSEPPCAQVDEVKLLFDSQSPR